MLPPPASDVGPLASLHCCQLFLLPSLDQREAPQISSNRPWPLFSFGRGRRSQRHRGKCSLFNLMRDENRVVKVNTFTASTP